MSYGYDEKSAGVAVPGPMVSGGVQVGYGVWGREGGGGGGDIGGVVMGTGVGGQWG